jgi:hypothetical protein
MMFEVSPMILELGRSAGGQVPDPRVRKVAQIHFGRQKQAVADKP